MATVEQGTEKGRIGLTSPSQRRLWFLDHFTPNSAAYNIAFSLRFHGPLNVAALRRSLNALVARQAVLRTSFAAIDGLPIQVIVPGLTLPLPVFDLRPPPEAERGEQVAQLTRVEAQQPFDLRAAPLLRTTLLQLGDLEHLLLITIHHIISDEWSLDLLCHELARFYTADVSNRPATLPDLSVQYADYAQQQEEWLLGTTSQKSVSYWIEQLAGAPVTVTIPSDRPRLPVQTSRGAAQSVDLSSGFVESLRRLGQRQGATLYMTTLAAFFSLLYRYTGQDDLVVGSPVAGRTRTEYEGLIGFFVNTLILRADLTGNPTFRDLLDRIRSVTLDAYTHQDVPFDRLVEVLKPDRDLSYSPMFQVMFVFLNTPDVSTEFADLTVQARAEETGSSKFDLTMYLEENTNGLLIKAEYNTDLFDPGTIGRLLGHYQVLLKSILIAPDVQLSTLPLLTRAERHQTCAWNATQVPYPDFCIHELFVHQARRTPQAVAVAHGQEEMTFRELDCRSNQLANHLRSLGVDRGTLVGLCVERSPEMIVGLLGILKAGGAYLPLDPSYPRGRLTHMLQDSQVELLVVQERLLAYLPTRPGSTVCIDRQWPSIAQRSTDDPTVETKLDDPAYVIYTSGSSGRPKGVLGLHRGAVNRFQWMWHTYPFAPEEICCQKTALSFVDSVWEIFGPLLQGIRTVILSDQTVRDPQALVQALGGCNVTRIVLVPSLLRVLLDTFPDLASRLPRLRSWVTSGEVLPVDLAERFLAALPYSRLVNLYGSSEVSADVTWYELSASSAQASIPIGRPIANTEIHIVDRHFQETPIGVPGEICVGGAGLARGYLRRPDLTAAAFVPNPFCDDVDARLYRTGDIGRCRANGIIEYLGRVDQQIKLRGMRIELGEIETALRQHPDVADATVLLEVRGADDARLAGYVVLRPERGAGSNELKQHLRDSLPAYMVPTTITVLDKLPRTPNGKLDRLALPGGGSTRADAGPEQFVPPRTPEEVRLAEIWKSVLRLDAIGVNDDFFALGGHSLLAMQVISRIRDAFHTELPLQTLFTSPTIATLSQHLLAQAEMTDLPARRIQPQPPVPATGITSVSATHPRLAKVHATGTRRPFFFLYPEVAAAFYGLDLARHLGEDQPFYIVHPHGFDSGPIPLTIEEMAANTVKLVRAIQPKGPYLLGARCAAGTEAFELARRLQAEGQKIDLLVLIDAEIPPYISTWLPRIRRMGEFLRLSEIRQRRLYASLSKPRQKYKFQLTAFTKLLQCVKDLPRMRDLSALECAWSDLREQLRVGGRLIDYRDLYYMWAFDGYRPGWYQGQVTLFLSEEWMATRYEEVVGGWRRLAGSVTTIGIGGTHHSCVTDYVPTLAAQLRSCLLVVEHHAPIGVQV
jgi:amino acid adenylation domain-containing protein